VVQESMKVIFSGRHQCFVFPSVLRHCWLGDSKTFGL